MFNTTSASVLMPKTIYNTMIDRARSASVVARLSAQIPMKFGQHEVVTFNDLPRAEFVDEGGEKGSTTGTLSSVTVSPKVAHVTMRFSNQLKWADEDHQLGVIEQLAEAGQEALARALDLGVIHRINPLTGGVIADWNDYIAASDKIVEVSADTEVDAAFREAAGLVILDPSVNDVDGAAFDREFGFRIANLTNSDGKLRYPGASLAGVSSLHGLPVETSTTVSGHPEIDDSGIRAIVGDFNRGIRWGVQRELPIELIETGDPDGKGDLKRKNEIALRIEIALAWYADASKFALVKNAEVTP